MQLVTQFFSIGDDFRGIRCLTGQHPRRLSLPNCLLAFDVAFVAVQLSPNFVDDFVPGETFDEGHELRCAFEPGSLGHAGKEGLPCLLREVDCVEPRPQLCIQTATGGAPDFVAVQLDESTRSRI